MIDNPFLDLNEYELRHLAEHLEASGRATDLHRLLTLEANEHRNAWYEIKKRSGNIAGYLSDVRLAWQLVIVSPVQSNNPSKSPQELPYDKIGLQIRYALITASQNSIAQNITPSLLLALVRGNDWTGQQGLVYARQIPEPNSRSQALGYMLLYTPKNQRQDILTEAVDAIQKIGDKYERARAFAHLAQFQDEEERKGAIMEALGTAREIGDESNRALALADLAQYLKGDGQKEVLAEALAAAKSVEIKEDEDGVYGYTEQASALICLAPYLEGNSLEQALIAARSIEDQYARTDALIAFIPYLRGKQRKVIISEVLETVCKESYHLTYHLIGLIPLLGKAQHKSVLSKILDDAYKVSLESTRVQALLALVPYLGNDVKSTVLSDALDTIQKISDADERVQDLTNIAVYLVGEQRLAIIALALDTARKISDRAKRTQILLNLIPQLTEKERGTVLVEVLDGAQEIRDEYERTQALNELAARRKTIKHQANLHKTMPSSQKNNREVKRSHILDNLSMLLDGSTWQSALALLLNSDQNSRDGTYRAYNERSSDSWKRYSQVRALTDLVPYLMMGVRQIAARKALNAASEIVDESRINILGDLAPYLAKTDLARALRIAQDFKYDINKSLALRELIPYLTEELLNYMLAAARRIEDAHARAEVLIELIPKLARDEQRNVLTEVWTNIPKIESESERATTLIDLAPYLPSELLAGALSYICAFDNKNTRAHALIMLRSRFMELGHERLVALWEDALPVLSSRTRKDLLDDLQALNPVFQSIGGEETITKACISIQDVGRWWP